MNNKIRNVLALIGPYLYFISAFLMIVCESFKLLLFLFFILGIISYMFSKIYCVYHIINNREKTHDKWILHLVFILLFGPLYIPFYYIYCVLKKKMLIGILASIILPILFIIMIIGLIIFDIINYNEYNDSITKDGKVKITLPSRFKCNNLKISNYQLYCETDSKDEFVGIYNFEDREDYSYLFDYYYENIYEQFDKNGQIENINKKDLYATFDVDNYGSKYQVIVDLKKYNNNAFSIIVFVCEQLNSGEYNKVYSSMNQIISENFI